MNDDDNMDFLVDDDMDFLADDEEASGEERQKGLWNILIIDDDEDVHQATKYALSKFSFMDKEIKWFEAYSCEEAKRLAPTLKDVAMILLDVVMETDDAGLRFMKWFRSENISPATRVILRTGQPGQAPERHVIIEYDLHDYKSKTDLSAEKLFTTTVAALRAFSDIRRLEDTRSGLEGIVDNAQSMFRIQSAQDYAATVLPQIESVLGIPAAALICSLSKPGDNNGLGDFSILGSVGEFKDGLNNAFALIRSRGEEACADYVIKKLCEESGSAYYAYIEPKTNLDEIRRPMLLMFVNNVAVGFNNIRMYDNVISAHKATVTTLAKVTEYRDAHTGEHINRIARGVEILAKEMLKRGVARKELSKEMVDSIAVASTLHDVGKISTPDSILLKPGSLTKEEFEVMKQHTMVGAEIVQGTIDLTDNSVEYLEMGRRIALYHHERWDGKGYPTGIAGKDIPIEARITSIMDVFDALTNKRCYKNAFSFEESMEIILGGKGQNFDPDVVEVFKDLAKKILEISK